MAFTSFEFLGFTALIILLYYILPKKIQWIILLAASLGFYLTWGWQALPFMLGSTLIAWWGAKRIYGIYEACSDQKTAKQKAIKILIPCLSGLLAILLYAKIGTRALQVITELTDGEPDAAIKVISILGVSYFTFSLIAYVADVYWKKIKPERNYFRLLLFVSYFPKVLQGPISRQNFLGPQLREEHKFNYSDFCSGLQLMVWGYFKKLVIADRLALMTNRVFGNIEGESGSHLLVALFFSAFQIYCDFSGCMDIAGGLSEVLGLKLEQNFDHPFFSKSAAEFWRRWHITLGSWCTNYLFTPIATSPWLIHHTKFINVKIGKRVRKAILTLIPLLAVWLFTGLWHGTGWNYIVWGIYWFIIIGVTSIFAPEIKRFSKKLQINTNNDVWILFQVIRTFCLFLISRIFSATGDLRLSMTIFRKIFADFRPWHLVDGSLYTLGMDRPDFILACVCIVVLMITEVVELKKGSIRELVAGSPIIIRWFLYYLLFFSILIFGIYGPGYDAGSFVYMQF